MPTALPPSRRHDAAQHPSPVTAESQTPRAAVLLPLAATVGAMAAFQVGAAFAQRLFHAIGPEGAAGLRLALGAVMLLILSRPWRAWPKNAPLLPLLGLGAATAGAVLFFYLAISRLPQGVAITLQFLGPLTVAVVSSRRAADLIWVALAAAGVWLLVGLGQAGGRLDPLGVVFALAAAASWGGYIVLGRSVSAAHGGATAALSVTIAAVIVLPIGALHAGPALLSPAILPLALLVAALSTVIPFSLEFYALPRLPARTFAIFTSLEPVLGVLSGFFLLGQRLGPWQILGVSVVIVAAAGAAWTAAGRGGAAATPDLGDAPPT
jgi:inner membrane transporter RhtA